MQKPNLQVTTLGHVDHGKSTVMGHLLVQLGRVPEDRLAHLRDLTERFGKATFEFAYIFDTTEEERRRGITIEASREAFETNRNHVLLIDCPGHRDFTKNMIVGVSAADAALLVVSAASGEAETGLRAETRTKHGGQTLEHLSLARIFGIDQLVVVVNKMDACEYSRERFEDIVGQVRRALEALKWNLGRVAFLPISGLRGDNLIGRSSSLSWFRGPTLLEAIDCLDPPALHFEELPLRIPVQKAIRVTGVGNVFLGRVEAGRIARGNIVEVIPGCQRAVVRSIECDRRELDSAGPPLGIGISLGGLRDVQAVGRGSVLAAPGNGPLVVGPRRGFEAKVAILSGAWIHPGFTPVMHIHAAQVPVRLEAIVSNEDGEDYQLGPGDLGIIRLRPLAPVAVEEFQKFGPMGRFALRDQSQTVAAGIITHVLEE